jgi:hypothetical protein
MLVVSGRFVMTAIKGPRRSLCLVQYTNIVIDLLNKPTDWCKDMGCISSVLAAKEHNVTSEKACFLSQNVLFINLEMTSPSWNIVGQDVAVYILKFASSMRRLLYWYVQIWIHNLHISKSMYYVKCGFWHNDTACDTLRSNSVIGLSSSYSFK